MSVHRLSCSAIALVLVCMAAIFFADRAEAAEGFASWYAPDPENAGEFTAVHATLPVGTVLTVRYGEKWVEVAVIGRGINLNGRDLDISQAPAEFLGLTQAGADFVNYTYPGEATNASAAYASTTEYSGSAASSMDLGYDAGYAAPEYAAPQAEYSIGYVEPYLEPSTTETPVSETAVPETAVPETAVPETAVPETAVPETVVPETVVPEAAAPATAQPEVATYTEPSVADAPVWDGAPDDGMAADGMADTDALNGGEEYMDPQVASSGYSPGYEEAIWYPASDYGNYTAADRPSSNPVDKIVVHTTQGSYESAMNWFQDPASGVSAHYTVRSSDGAVGQSVSEMNIAHHAGNWDYNQTSVGIEIEGYVEDASWYTDAMYQSSAQVGAHLVNKYGIPVDRQHIIGHDEVPGATHTDPGPYWDWDLYLAYIQDYAGTAPAEPAPVW